MATTLTSNLKLRVADSLTDDAKFNLNRIDTLGALTSVDSLGTSHYKSAGDISIEPNSSDIGGSGSGGTVSVGESGASISLFDIHSTSVDFNGASVSGLSIDAADIADGSVSNAEFQYLDGVTSNIQDQLDSISGTNQLVETWDNSDGTTLTITHGFGTRNVLVQVLDEDCNFCTVDLADVQRPNDNQVVLNSAEAPATSFRVLLAQIGS